MRVTFYKSGPNGREAVKTFNKESILLPLRGELVKFKGSDITYGVVKTTNIYNDDAVCSLEIDLVEGDFE